MDKKVLPFLRLKWEGCIEFNSNFYSRTSLQENEPYPRPIHQFICKYKIYFVNIQLLLILCIHNSLNIK